MYIIQGGERCAKKWNLWGKNFAVTFFFATFAFENCANTLFLKRLKK